MVILASCQLPVASFQLSVPVRRPDLQVGRCSLLAELEFHGDFDDHVDGRTVARGGGEPPLPHRIDRSLIQASAESMQELDVADAAVAPHDDLEDDV
ncbi:MAG TPA: hypothetical protein VFK20_00985, partial [Vicinamibacterales bacterium]|nr:hypothetical protein [Vicinamibacterales bacterium]